MSAPTAPRRVLERIRPTRRALTGRGLRVALSLALALSVVAAPGVAAAKKKTARELHAELMAVQSQARKAGNEFDRAWTKLENTDWSIKVTDRRLKKELRNLREGEKVLGIRVAAMYRGGGQTDMVDFVLGAASFEDLAARMDYVSMIAERDSALVASIKQKRLELAAKRTRLLEARKLRREQALIFRQKRDAMYKQLAAAQGRYMKVMAELQAAMAREMAEGFITYVPKGANGMVFPVQGPNSYRDTWGAPRSGGRRHKGTDIMADTGTPIVAITSGTVRRHDSSLGGICVTLTGDNGWQYYYAHCSKIIVGSGRVKAGQVIAKVGDSGNAKGTPHLHLQMGPGGNWVDPYPYLRAME